MSFSCETHTQTLTHFASKQSKHANLIDCLRVPPVYSLACKIVNGDLAKFACAKAQVTNLAVTVEWQEIERIHEKKSYVNKMPKIPLLVYKFKDKKAV